MNLTKLYAELQVNPLSITAYRNLADVYLSMGMKNEADAFLELIRRKFNANSTNIDEEQQ